MTNRFGLNFILEIVLGLWCAFQILEANEDLLDIDAAREL